jgi:hypothetical protein
MKPVLLLAAVVMVAAGVTVTILLLDKNDATVPTPPPPAQGEDKTQNLVDPRVINLPPANPGAPPTPAPLFLEDGACHPDLGLLPKGLSAFVAPPPPAPDPLAEQEAITRRNKEMERKRIEEQERFHKEGEPFRLAVEGLSDNQVARVLGAYYDYHSEASRRFRVQLAANPGGSDDENIRIRKEVYEQVRQEMFRRLETELTSDQIEQLRRFVEKRDKKGE